MLSVFTLQAQEVNWKNRDENTKHFIGINAGIDYSSYYGISYGHFIKNNYKPLMVCAESNIPFGKNILDDFAIRVGLQSELYGSEHLSWTVKSTIINRKYKSDIANLNNIGADFETSFEYILNHWGIAGLINYDRSISTHIEHLELKKYYPEIQDGCYNTRGGNFKFAARVHCDIKATSVFFTIGKIYGQDFNSNPTLPFFLRFAVSKSF